MEILTIVSPGETGGPCKGSCSHPACLWIRELALARCPHCLMLLGFGSKVTGTPPMHLRCARTTDAGGGSDLPARHPRRPNRPI